MAGKTEPFDLSKMAFGGLGQMFDGIDSVKRAWSMFNAPSALIPTLDVDELDKRIADLKAVEQWLNLNVNMLRGTIQGLEIQRGTLAAVKAFGASFSGAAPAGAASRASSWAEPKQGPAASPAPASPPRPEPEPSKSSRPAGAGRAQRTGTSAQSAGGVSQASTGTGVPGIDASAWWNLLQGTFNQVAQAALSGSGLPGSGGASATGAVAAKRKAAAAKKTRGAGKASTARARARN